MVAVARFIPQDPKEKESVLAVLREHPELQGFILRVSEKAEEIFPEVRIALDTVRYDEWDPPVTMNIWITEPWGAFRESWDRFTTWLSYNPDYDRDVVLVMPMWNGPIESYR
ncbi:MAG: hypothetical protein M3457_19840 [Chloroflexota bacterium]|nr:hypothetical protein [Chloroflexota bacterium]